MKDLKGAFIQRDKKTYAIVPRTPMGLVTPEQLEAIAATARKYDIPIIKITSAQRFALVGLKPEVIGEVWDDLSMRVGRAVELCLHYVQSCPGTAVCKMALKDSLSLAGKLEEKFADQEMPAKVKIGISGCTFNCGESYSRDFGAFAKKSGWTVIFGGNSGKNPRIGDIIAEGLSDEEVIELAVKCFDYYKDNAKKRERTARFIERIGIDAFKEAVL